MVEFSSEDITTYSDRNVYLGEVLELASKSKTDRIVMVLRNTAFRQNRSPNKLQKLFN